MNSILVKKTFELTPGEWRQIVEGFNEEFGRDKTVQDLQQFYAANSSGYSYHGLSVTPDGQLAGFTSVMPLPYRDAEGNTVRTGLSGSSFVRKAYRNDIFIFHDLYKAIRLQLQQEGFAVVLGVPNKNSYRYLVKLVGFRFLFNLPYYVLPVRPHRVLGKSWLRFAGPVFRAALLLYAGSIRCLTALRDTVEKSDRLRIEWEEGAYHKRFHAAYHTVEKGSGRFTYRIYDESGIRTAYLFDFRRRGQRSVSILADAVLYLLRHEAVDMILYMGTLSLRQGLLLRLPEKKQPRAMPLTVDVLVPETDPRYQRFTDPSAWDFGLLNFDVR